MPEVEEKEKVKEAAKLPAAAAVGGGAVAAHKVLKPVAYTPLDRKGQKVHRKLQNSKKDTVKLKPKEWAAIAGGRGGRVENDAYTARMAEGMRKKLLPKGGTQVKVYGNTVKQVGGAHRAQAASMLNRKVPVTITGRTTKKAPRLPAWVGERENLGAALQRQRIKDTRGMSRRKRKKLAASYTARAAKRNELKSKAEDVAMKVFGTKSGRAAGVGLLGAAALGTAGTANA